MTIRNSFLVSADAARDFASRAAEQPKSAQLQMHALGFSNKTGWLSHDLNVAGVVGAAASLSEAAKGATLAEECVAGLTKLLVEVQQELSDGRVRKRNMLLAEKMVRDEACTEAAVRGIAEELQVKLPVDELDDIEAAIGEHRGRDLAGPGAGIGPVHVLRADLDGTPVQRRLHLAHGGEGRDHEALDVVVERGLGNPGGPAVCGPTDDDELGSSNCARSSRIVSVRLAL